MISEHPGLRIFVLGAGFSRLAGLPLASELFPEIKGRIERRHGMETKFHQDVETFLEYRLKCDGLRIAEHEIDFEEFLSFLDMEHFLGLRGSKAWSREGNETQLIIRQHLAQIIHERTPDADKLPPAYYKFAENLSTTDTIITFNYDLLIERALEHIGKPYRLFQDRYKTISKYGATVDSDKAEVVILKMHGSIDWFSSREYERSLLDSEGDPLGYHPKHPIFTDLDRFGARPIIDGVREQSDPLRQVYRLARLKDFYSESIPLIAPLILSPSHVKFVYSTQLADFWYGMGRGGGLNFGISVVGFSLPKHDDYIRIALFKLVSNYQESWWDERYLSSELKDFVKFVDLRETDAGAAELMRRYRFSDPAKTRFYFDGFDEDAVEFLFRRQRTE